MSSFSDRLKAARDAKGLTQQQLAEKAGTQWQQISRWEREAANPRAKTIQALAEALGVAPSWLRDGQGPERLIPDDPRVFDPTVGSAAFLPLDPKLLALVSTVVSESLQSKGLRCSLPAWNQLVQEVYEAAEVLAPHENVISFDRFKESLEQAAERGIIKHRLA